MCLYVCICMYEYMYLYMCMYMHLRLCLQARTVSLCTRRGAEIVFVARAVELVGWISQLSNCTRFGAEIVFVARAVEFIRHRALSNLLRALSNELVRKCISPRAVELVGWLSLNHEV